MNLVFIILDACRPDHMSLYGYKRKTTPNIDKRSRGRVTFSEFRSVDSHTWPCLTSLFEGKKIPSHEVEWFPKKITPMHSVLNLPDILRQNGYHTSAFVTVTPIVTFMKIDQCFDKFMFLSDVENKNIFKETFSKFKECIEEVKDKPFFSYLHLNSTHGPYNPEHLRGAFEGDGLFETGKELELSEIDDSGFNSIPLYVWKGDLFLTGSKKKYDERTASKCVDYYLRLSDESVLLGDFYIEKIFKLLEKKKLLKDTVVIVSADHGDSQGENDIWFAHGHGLGYELTHVPFIAWFPWLKEPMTIHKEFNQVDFSTSILDLLRLDVPKEFEGKSFVKEIKDRVKTKDGWVKKVDKVIEKTDKLDKLKQRSIYIIREMKKKFKNPAIMWSTGKDSTAILGLVKEAFFGEIPFPVLHLDTSYKFPEMYKFRDEIAKQFGMDLIVAKNDKALKKGMNPKNHDKIKCCTALKTDTLKSAIKKFGFDAILVAIRRDEHGIRNLERYMSPRDKEFKWNVVKENIGKGDSPFESMQDTELSGWSLFETDFGKECSHVRIHPILHWTEQDVWDYIKKENLPVNPLYFSKKGKRYRSLGCMPCTKPIKSNAKTIDEIIEELKKTKEKEREGRSQDKESTYAMQDLRWAGYL